MTKQLTKTSIYDAYKLQEISSPEVSIRDRIHAVHSKYLSAIRFIKNDTSVAHYDDELKATEDLINASLDAIDDFDGQMQEHEQDLVNIQGLGEVDYA